MSNVFSAAQKLRLDGIQNLVTGMGVEAYDQSMGMQLFSRPILNQQQQSKLLKYGFLRKLVCATLIRYLAWCSFDPHY